MRMKREFLQRQMERIAAMLGKPTGSAWVREGDKNRAIIGTWSLDYNPIYGGYNVEEIVNELGAIHHPLGGTRMTGEAFSNALSMVAAALELSRREVAQHGK